ncbi:hypothetical protein [Mesobacillus foraminis]|uniref:hypothetical protein n=1 Tax=Mesobacillus foraminis TaxID=279826 RepID=UPI0013CEBCCC|nr:hypothetical protein [Mesobacillus foraminis]
MIIHLLCIVEGAQTPAGSAGQLRPAGAFDVEAQRPAPRKAKLLERKSAVLVYANKKKTADNFDFHRIVCSQGHELMGEQLLSYLTGLK